MLNRYYEYNSVQSKEPFVKGINEYGLKDAEAIINKINSSIDKFGDYIGYVKASVFVNPKTGDIEVPNHKNMRIPIWDILDLLKSKGVKVDDISNIDISSLLKNGTAKYTSTKSPSGKESSDRTYKKSRTLEDTRKIGPELGTENGHSKEGNKVVSWENAEFSNEKILLHAISQAFITVKNSGNWDAPITLPVFKYFNNRMDIEFTASSVKASELIYFFLGSVSQKINAAYHFAISKARERTENAEIEIKEKLDNDLGISNPVEWFNTTLQVLMYGPLKSAEKNKIFDIRDNTEKESENKINANFFEAKPVIDKLNIARSAFTFVDADKNFNDVGLFGLIADSVFPKDETNLVGLNLSYLGKYLSLKFSSADKMINSIVRSGEDSAEENSKLHTRDVVSKEKEAFSASNIYDTIEGKLLQVLESALIVDDKNLEKDKKVEIIRRGFLGKIGKEKIVDKGGPLLLDYYISYLLGGCTVNGAVLYSGIFVPTSNKNTLDSIVLSNNFLNDVKSQPSMNDFWMNPTVDKPFHHGKGCSISKLISCRDSDGRNVFDFIGVSEKEIDDLRSAYLKEIKDGNPISIRKIKDIEGNILARLFKVGKEDSVPRNSDTNWVKSFHLNSQSSKNKDTGTSDTKNKMSAVIKYMNDRLKLACDKVNDEDDSHTFTFDALKEIEKEYFGYLKAPLELRADRIYNLMNSLIHYMETSYDGEYLSFVKKSIFANGVNLKLFESLYNKIFKKSLKESLFESVFDKLDRN